MIFRSRSICLGVMTLLAIAAPVLADSESDIAGSAFVGRAPSEAERAFELERISAAQSYAACLLEANDTWFARPDYQMCDDLRAEYERFLAAEIAHLAIGCLEEGVLGLPRNVEYTCAAVRGRFPIVVSHFVTEEESP